jgi:phospholipid/cholesterol/gamma-HCH transport system substrate-binding protein
MAADLKETRRIRREAIQISAGAAAIALFIAGLAWASSGGRHAVASDSYSVTARFGSADGLTIGSPVLLAGMRVGTVARLEVDRASMRPVVTMAIDPGVRIPADSAAMILSDGVLGAKFVRIEAGAEERPLPPGGEFGLVQDSVIVEQILEKIVRGAEARRAPEQPK